MFVIIALPERELRYNVEINDLGKIINCIVINMAYYYKKILKTNTKHDINFF